MISAGLELARKYALSPSSWLALHGAKYRVLGAMSSPFLAQAKKWRNLLLAYISPSGVKPRSLVDFISSKSLQAYWKLPEYRAKRLKHEYLTGGLKDLLDSLNRLDGMFRKVKSLVEVRRDRGYYGTTPRTAEDGRFFSDLRCDGLGYLGTQSQSILEDLSNMLYREAYLDVLVEVRDIRNSIEEMSEGDALSDVALEEVGQRLEDLRALLASVPLPKEIYKRTVEEVPRLGSHRQVMTWIQYSKILRRNL